jgi:exosortase/archaeosortase family protein
VGSRSPARGIGRPGAVLALELLAFWPSLHWFYLRTRYASEERWQLVALGAALLLVVLRGRERVAREPREPSPEAGLLAPILGVVGYALVQPVVPPLVAACLAALILVLSTSRLVLGRRFDVALFGLGLLALPVVPVFQFHLGFPLRLVTAMGAARLLGLGGLDVVSRGTSLDWEGTLVWVDAPCSGLRMLWTTLLLAASIAALWRLSAVATVAAGAAALLLVVLANSLRAAALFYLEAGLVEAPAGAHAAIGLATQGFAALTLLAALTRFRKAPDREEPCALPACT